MRKTQLLDNNPNSIYGASKKLANVSIRNILSNPVQNDAMSQNLNMTLPKTINKDTNVEEFLGKILDCDSYLQQMYLYVYASEHQYGNHGRYSYKDRGTSNILERDDSDNGASGAGLSDNEDDEDDYNYNLTKSQLNKLTISELESYQNRFESKMNNKSSDSEKTYKMTEEDYRSIGVNPLKINNREYFLNSPKPSPLDIMKASMNNVANRRVYSLNRPRDYYFYDSSNPGSIASSSNQKSIASNSLNTDHLQIHPESSHRSSSSNPKSSLQSGYDDDDGDNSSVHWDDLSSLPVFGDDDISDINPFDIKDGLITEMSKFNKKMNELYIFFKGKIKPNLKTISKQDIQDILKDMNQLDYNFTDVLHAVEDLDVFGLEKDIKHAKVDAFKQTFETNFKKSSADIISSVKAYSSLGMYSTSSVPDNILFNSKFPTFDGKGLSLECLRCGFTVGFSRYAYRETQHTQKASALLFGFHDFTVVCKMA